MDTFVMTARDRVAVVCAIVLSILWFSVFGFDALGSRELLPGLGITVFTVALFATLLGLLGKRARHSRATYGLLVAVFLLASIPAIYSDPVLTALDCLVLLGTCVVEICLLSGLTARAWDHALVVWSSVRAFLRSLFAHVLRPLQSISTRTEGSTERRRSIVLGLLMGCGVLLLAVPLLMSADSVFCGMFDISRWFSSLRLMDVWKVIRVLLLAPLLFSLLFSAMHDGEKSVSAQDMVLAEDGTPAEGRTPTEDWASAQCAASTQGVVPVKGPDTARTRGDSRNTMIIVALALIDLVYLVFVAVQFVYLFGGVESMRMAGGYAGYARSGFFQLVAVTVIDLGVALGAMKLEDMDGSVPGRRAVAILMSVLLVATAVMLASAAFRMGLYVSAYGMSLLRSLTYLAMVFIAVLLITTGIKVAKRETAFFRVFLVAGLTLWIVFNLSGVDARIAGYDVDGYLSGDIAKVDVEYLAYLSPATLPELDRLAESQFACEVADAHSYWDLQLDTGRLPWQMWTWDRR